MSKIKIFQRSKSRDAAPAAHMTWASRTVAGTVTKTRQFLGRQLWAWPIIAVVLLVALGWGVHGAIERTMESNLRSQLQTLLDVEVAMLKTWLAAQESNAKSAAGDTEVRRLVETLLGPPLTDEQPSSKSGSLAQQLAKRLGPAMNSHDYDSFFVADRATIVASTRQEAVGMEIPIEFRSIFEDVYDGETTVTPPYASRLPQLDSQGQQRTGVPVMTVLAPVVDDNLQVIAVLGLQIRPEKEFTRILQIGRLGDSGETYAFDQEGLLLSNSRFDDDLILLGLLPDQKGTRSILQLFGA